MAVFNRGGRDEQAGNPLNIVAEVREDADQDADGNEAVGHHAKAVPVNG